ncbi:hypothetical protein [Levilactobacillus namurensis]|nr:hypothetical protein [Levilactobacillus namurensis]MDT7014369.1 hypothetical protein [Levilactobacillus namurensis]
MFKTGCHPQKQSLSPRARQRLLPFVAFELTATTVVLADLIKADSV